MKHCLEGKGSSKAKGPFDGKRKGSLRQRPFKGKGEGHSKAKALRRQNKWPFEGTGNGP